MIDEPQPGAVPENVAKPKQEGQGMVASYDDSATVDNLNPAKIVERWKGEKKGVPEPKITPSEKKEDFYKKIAEGDFKSDALKAQESTTDQGMVASYPGEDTSTLNPAKIVERWKGEPAKAEPVSIPTVVTPAKK